MLMNRLPRDPEQRPDRTVETSADKVLDTSADKVLNASSNKPISPWDMDTALAVLTRYARSALLQRGRGKKSRLQLDFPELKITYPRGRIDPTTGERRQRGSYSRDIWLFLETWGFRTLNDLDRDNITPPPRDLLVELLEEHVMHHAETHNQYDGHGVRGSLDIDGIHKTARKAAEHVLRDWTPDYRREHAERSAKGGRNGHRGTTKNTDANYARFLRLPRGLTREQQAKRLKVSTGTIDRLRARQRRDDPFWDLL